MTKREAAMARVREQLANHKFDTSKYIIIKSHVQRDAAPGQLKLSESQKNKKK